MQTKHFTTLISIYLIMQPQQTWAPWQPIALTILVGIVAGLVLAGLALGLGLGICLHNSNANLTSFLPTNST